MSHRRVPCAKRRFSAADFGGSGGNGGAKPGGFRNPKDNEKKETATEIEYKDSSKIDIIFDFHGSTNNRNQRIENDHGCHFVFDF